MDVKAKIRAIEQRLGRVRLENPRKGEYVFTCPGRPGESCPSAAAGKAKLSVNPEKDWFNCWVCGFKGRSLAILMRPGSEERRGYLETHVPSRVAMHADVDVKCDRVPDGFTCLDGEAPVTAAPYLHYLRHRGVTDEVRSLYRVGYVDGRIVVPSFDAVGMVNFWSARTIHPDTRPAYRLPEATKDIISNDYLTDWTRPIYLVEGIFDEMAIGPQAISLYGKFLGPTLAQKIVRTRPPVVYVCLDDDARHEAVRLVKRLVGYDVSCCLLDLPCKDPGTMGGDAVREFALGSSVITGSAGLVSAIGRL